MIAVFIAPVYQALKDRPINPITGEMSHFTGTVTTLTSEAISKESEKPYKFEAKTTLGSAEITEITGSVSLLVKGEEVTGAGIFAAGTTVVSVEVGAKTAILSTKAEKEGAKEKLEVKSPTFKPFKWTGSPQQTDFAEWITGTAFGSKKSKAEIQVCFDLPSPSEGSGMSVEEWASKGNWVPASWPEFLEKANQPAVYKLAAKESVSISAFAGAPYWRVVVTGEEDVDEIRVYAHAFERGRV